MALLADLLGPSASTLRQQLREWCYDAKYKKGTHRQEVDVTRCFAPLLCWIVSKWPAAERRLALAMDATTLSDRFTVLAISVLYRGCANPGLRQEASPLATPLLRISATGTLDFIAQAA